MKAIVESVAQSPTREKSRWTILCELAKARLTFLVLLTTLVGFHSGSRNGMNLALLAHTMIGTAIIACAAAALNQYLERDVDALMRRTEDRPLPSHRMQPGTVLAGGIVASFAGLAYLAVAVNALTALLGAITLASYLFIYTPLKRVTTLNTAIGAIPGALPPLMGWTAASGQITTQGWALFAILFFWQMPHFLAISWMYRDEYAKAGFAMVSVFDPDGRRTSSQAVSHSLGLLPISLCPALFGMAGVMYFIGALAMGLYFLYCAIQFARERSVPRARKLFFFSILYLPLLLGLLAIDKVK